MTNLLTVLGIALTSSQVVSLDMRFNLSHKICCSMGAGIAPKHQSGRGGKLLGCISYPGLDIGIGFRQIHHFASPRPALLRLCSLRANLTFSNLKSSCCTRSLLSYFSKFRVIP